MIPRRGTLVTYPAGATTSTGTVVHVADAGQGRSAVVLDATAFHPVDAAWPDQPADRGRLRVGDDTFEVVDAVVAASDGESLFLGREVPVRTGTEGWSFFVAHIVEGQPVGEGDTVVVEADREYRAALSVGHTACHLASLALDASLTHAWSKPTPTDALGAPAFDALAIQESRILPNGSRDVYRIGKSLRRKGFDPAALVDLEDLQLRVDDCLADWVETSAPVRVEAEGELLADRRAWVCSLPGSEARIPCGGTHVESLAELLSVSVVFEKREVEGGVELIMTTTAVRV